MEIEYVKKNKETITKALKIIFSAFVFLSQYKNFTKQCDIRRKRRTSMEQMMQWKTKRWCGFFLIMVLIFSSLPLQVKAESSKKDSIYLEKSDGTNVLLSEGAQGETINVCLSDYISCEPAPYIDIYYETESGYKKVTTEIVEEGFLNFQKEYSGNYKLVETGKNLENFCMEQMVTADYEYFYKGGTYHTDTKQFDSYGTKENPLTTVGYFDNPNNLWNYKVSWKFVNEIAGYIGTSGDYTNNTSVYQKEKVMKCLIEDRDRKTGKLRASIYIDGEKWALTSSQMRMPYFLTYCMNPTEALIRENLENHSIYKGEEEKINERTEQLLQLEQKKNTAIFFQNSMTEWQGILEYKVDVSSYFQPGDTVTFNYLFGCGDRNLYHYPDSDKELYIPSNDVLKEKEMTYQEKYGNTAVVDSNGFVTITLSNGGYFSLTKLGSETETAEVTPTMTANTSQPTSTTVDTPTPTMSTEAPVQEVNGYWSAYAAENFQGGSGTEEDPYQIATPEQLAYFAQIINSEMEEDSGLDTYRSAYYQLIQDIDLSSHQWVPIGILNREVSQIHYSPGFKGVFDGNGYTVKGLTITYSTQDAESNGIKNKYAGLFGFLSGATVKNLGMVDTYIHTDYSYVGSLCGFWYLRAIEEGMRDTFIDNCYFRGELCSTDSNGAAGAVTGIWETMGNHNSPKQYVHYAAILNCYLQCNLSAPFIGHLTGIVYRPGGVHNIYYARNVYYEDTMTKNWYGYNKDTGKNGDEDSEFVDKLYAQVTTTAYSREKMQTEDFAALLNQYAYNTDGIDYSFLDDYDEALDGATEYGYVKKNSKVWGIDSAKGAYPVLLSDSQKNQAIYAITLEASKNDAIDVSSCKKTTNTVTVKSKTDKKMIGAYYEWNGERIDIYADNNGTDTLSFTMPEGPITLSVFLEGETIVYPYSIQAEENENGKITVPKQAKEGEIVSVGIKPKEGKKLENLEVTTASGQKVEVEGNTFKMPGEPVTIKVQFIDISYPIQVSFYDNNQKIDGDTGYLGKVNVQATAVFGEDVAVSATAADNKMIENIEIITENGTLSLNEGNTFTMPSEGVELRLYYADAYTKWSNFAADGFTGGTGDEESPYLIQTAEQLARFSNLINQGETAYTTAFYKLISDIDLSGHLWVPIGNKDTGYFQGTFDGDGYQIKNMNITDKSNLSLETIENAEEYSGLFGCAYLGKNQSFNLKNIRITDSNIETSSKYCGGFIGLISYGTKNNTSVSISNCSFNGNIKHTYQKEEDSGAGGLIGVVNNITEETEGNFLLESCYSQGTISTVGNNVMTGGLIGDMKVAAAVSIHDIYSTATVSGKEGCSGNLFGSIHFLTVENAALNQWFTTDVTKAIGTNNNSEKVNPILKTFSSEELPFDLGYSIHFDCQGGKTVSSISQLSQGEVVEDLPVTAKAGYKFLGWYVKENQEEKEIEKITISDSDVTVYAKWENQMVDITTLKATGAGTEYDPYVYVVTPEQFVYITGKTLTAIKEKNETWMIKTVGAKDDAQYANVKLSSLKIEGEKITGNIDSTVNYPLYIKVNFNKERTTVSFSWKDNFPMEWEGSFFVGDEFYTSYAPMTEVLEEDSNTKQQLPVEEEYVSFSGTKGGNYIITNTEKTVKERVLSGELTYDKIEANAISQEPITIFWDTTLFDKSNKISWKSINSIVGEDGAKSKTVKLETRDSLTGKLIQAVWLKGDEMSLVPVNDRGPFYLAGVINPSSDLLKEQLSQNELYSNNEEKYQTLLNNLTSLEKKENVTLFLAAPMREFYGKITYTVYVGGQYSAGDIIDIKYQAGCGNQSDYYSTKPEQTELEDKEMSYSSYDSSAIVDYDGYLTFTINGGGVFALEKTGSAKSEGTDFTASIKLSSTILYTAKGSCTGKVKVTLSDDVKADSIIFESSNPKIAKIGKYTGKITAKKQGSTIIKIKVCVNGVTKTYQKKITVKKSYLKILGWKKTLQNKKTMVLKVKKYGVTGKVVWKSSNSKIATVSKTGKVTAKRKGIVSITGTVGTIKKKVKVVVK